MAQLPRNPHGGLADPRISYLLKTEEKLVQCPYEKSHFVMEPKLAGHLRKCRHNYLNSNKGKDPKISVCRHFYMHHVPTKELQEHEDNCPFNLEAKQQQDNAKMEFEKRLTVIGADATEISQEGMHKRKVMEDRRPERPSDKRKSDKSSEVEQEIWEPNEGQEVQMPTLKDRFNMYDPREHLRRNAHDIVLNPQGLTRAEKEEYREKLSTGHLDDPEEEELPPIVPRFVRPARDTRVPIGFPGWDVDQGTRRASQQERRMGPR